MATATSGFWNKMRRSFYLSSIDVGIEHPTGEQESDTMLNAGIQEKQIEMSDVSSLSLFANSVHAILDEQIAEE